MEILAGICLVLALIVMPIFIILALIKPKLFDPKGEHKRSELVAGGMVFLVVFLIAGLFLLPKDITDTVTASNEATKHNKAQPTEKIAEPLPQSAPIATTSSSLTEEKNLNITPDEFVKNFNTTASTIDKNWIINYVINKDTGNIDFAPMPENVRMLSSVTHDNKLKVITLGFGGGAGGDKRLIQITSMILGASSSANPTIEKGQISKKIVNIVDNSFKHKNTTQIATIGDVQYSASFMPDMGGEIFIIEPKQKPHQ